MYPLYASDIAVPYGRPENYEESNAIHLNYYPEYNESTQQWEYVFWNYTRIASGTNAAFQVLYTGAEGDADIDIMKTVDGSEWTLQPVAELWEPNDDGVMVQKEYRTDMTPLTGNIDTYAHLESVNKEPMNIAGKSYGPELYTENQINRFASHKVDGFNHYGFDWDFEDYSYIAWTVRATAYATQAYDMYIRDYVNIEGGELVGFDRNVTPEIIDGDTWYRYDTKNTARDYNKTVNLVVRYPKENIKNNEGEYIEIWNDADIRLVPHDKKDRHEIKHDREPYIYHDFEWNYAGDGETLAKSGAGDFYSWLDVYKCAKEQGKDKGDFTFRVSSSARGYAETHETEADYNADPPRLIGAKKEGCAYEITTADDLLWAYYNNNQSNKTMLTGADYYFSKVNFEITDVDYDPYEDESVNYQQEEDMPNIKMYAVFADGETDASLLNSDTWEEVTSAERTVQKNGDKWTFTFNADEIRRMPYRVKAVNTTAGYETMCRISIDVRIRHTSPVFENYLAMGIKSLNNPTGLIDRVVVINEAALVRRDITPQGITAHVNVTDNKTKALYSNPDGSGGTAPGATDRKWGT